jgi:type IV pilus assembly protein PilC
MPNFSFKGRKRGGEQIAGSRMAESTSALAMALRSEDIVLVEAREKKGFNLRDLEIGGNPTPKDLAIFTRQFSVMIDAGLPLVQCLEILGSQQENKKFSQAIRTVTREVESGNTLASGMRQSPKVFDELYTNMVEAGEAGGILDTIFQRLAVYIEKSVKLKAAMKSAMVYPAAIIFIASAVITLILWKVVPAFTELFNSMEVELPLPTRIVIAASSFVGGYGLFVLVGLGILVFLFRSYYATPKGRYNVDRLILKLPVFGVLVRKISVARFTRTLGTLISSGVPILEALDITARTAGNAVVEEAIFNVKSAIETGRTIVDPLKESGVFPNMVIQMIGVGEETGALEPMLNKIADFYEEEVDTAVGDLMTAIEPMMMAVLGIVVGGIVISMYMPIFSLVGQLSG